MTRIPLDDLENSMRRLDLIMGRRRLCFNPYTVSDERLMDIVSSYGWGNEYDLTQIVTLHFTRLHEVETKVCFDGIFARMGNLEGEIFFPSWRLKFGVTASDTLRHESTKLDNRSILHDEQVAKLVGKSVFISHIIRGVTARGHANIAYKMHRMKGKMQDDADMIRRAMCDAKTTMLLRLRENPDCIHYLDCRPDLFDFRSRIDRALALISRFPDASPK